MKPFAHFNARSIDEAVSLLQRYENRAVVIAGGTDLLGKMKDNVMPTYPEAVINIKTVDDLDFIEEHDGIVGIGALTRLEDVAMNGTVRLMLPALAQAAARTASPHLRAMGTMGGNICQDVRCWYYRNANNRFQCLRKGGGRCYAIEGDNRYHSIFGGSVEGGCYAVHPSDTAPALVALNAEIKTSRRTVPADDFFAVNVSKNTMLAADEIVKEIRIPAQRNNTKSHFLKFALRKSIDFPIVNCAAAIGVLGGKVVEARICLNAVYVRPYRAREAEEFLTGKTMSAKNIESAADIALSAAQPMSRNGWMVQVARTIVKRTLFMMVNAQ